MECALQRHLNDGSVSVAGCWGAEGVRAVGAAEAELPGLHGGRLRDPVHDRPRLQRQQSPHGRPCLIPLRGSAMLPHLSIQYNAFVSFPKFCML